MQRFLDIILAGTALVLLSPLLLAVMLVLRLTGEGEIFFKQSRIGLGRRPFGILKFATMVKDSPSIGTGTVTLKDDPRVLPVGRFLRKTKVNELPQLLNIVRGEMSVIGPRPQTERCFKAFPDSAQAAIGSVPPGLSGIGSIVFRDEEELMEASRDPDQFYDRVIMPYKGELEEWYTRNRTLVTYCKLLFITVWVVLFPASGIVWRAFPDLPRPQGELASLLYQT